MTSSSRVNLCAGRVILQSPITALTITHNESLVSQQKWRVGRGFPAHYFLLQLFVSASLSLSLPLASRCPSYSFWPKEKSACVSSYALSLGIAHSRAPDQSGHQFTSQLGPHRSNCFFFVPSVYSIIVSPWKHSTSFEQIYKSRSQVSTSWMKIQVKVKHLCNSYKRSILWRSKK